MINEVLGSLGGDLWCSAKMVALWPWPAVVVGKHRQRFTWDDYRVFTRLLKPGDFLLCRADQFLPQNRAIPGAFKHLAVYTGPCQVGGRDAATGFILKARPMRDETVPWSRTVTHAIKEGVVVQDLGEVLFHYDYVCAVRATENDTKRRGIVAAALDAVGMAYNFAFRPTSQPQFYCTELGLHCMNAVGLTGPQKTRIMTAWWGGTSMVPLADAFVKTLPMVCCSTACSAPAFMRQGRDDEVRQKIVRARDACMAELSGDPLRGEEHDGRISGSRGTPSSQVYSGGR